MIYENCMKLNVPCPCVKFYATPFHFHFALWLLVLKMQGWIVGTDIRWPEKPERFSGWSFPEPVHQPPVNRSGIKVRWKVSVTQQVLAGTAVIGTANDAAPASQPVVSMWKGWLSMAALPLFQNKTAIFFNLCVIKKIKHCKGNKIDLWVNLDTSVNWRCTSPGCERKPGYLDETHQTREGAPSPHRWRLPPGISSLFFCSPTL